MTDYTDYTANTFFDNLDTAQTTAYEGALEQCYQQAANSYREVIYPWWSAFVGSQAALDLAVLLPEQPRRALRLTSNLQYRTDNGGQKTCYIALGGDVRALSAAVRFQVEGRTPTGWAGSMLAAVRHPLPLTHPTLPADFEMNPATIHPLVLVDFAEQITAGVVDAHIRRHLRR